MIQSGFGLRLPTHSRISGEYEQISKSLCAKNGAAKTVNFDEEMMHVSLTDGRLISVPLIWFPLLRAATPEQRTKCEIGGGGSSLHWPELDEDLSVAGLLAGADWQAA